MGDLTTNFDKKEFACPCCGKAEMHGRTVSRLQAVRDAYGKPIGIVTGGGYRCSNYSTSHFSAHNTGEAVDLNIPVADLYKVLSLSIGAGFTGIGIKNKNGKWQLHIDDARELPGIRPRPWVWTY